MTFLGGAFRFYNPNWNLGHEIHPDERNILNAVNEIRCDSGFKVSFFAYGQLPAYLYRLTGELLSAPRFLSNAFQGRIYSTLACYWLFLLAIFSAALWFLSREKWKIQAFGTSFALFAAALALRFFNVFNAWFSFLDGQNLNLDILGKLHLSLPTLSLVSFAVVAAASLVISFLVAWILDLEWLGLPFYIAAGATFLLGFVPTLMPADWHLCQITATFSFTLGLLALAGLFAWYSVWGRILLGLFPICTVLASLDHAWPSFTDAGNIMVIGHLWAAFFSTLTILVVYLFVRKAYGQVPMALLAAACFAFSAVSIEQAHYLITESFITLMFVIIALSALRISEDGSWRSYLLAGTAFGLAMAAKTSSLYYLFMIVVGHLVYVSKTPEKKWQNADQKNRRENTLHNVVATFTLVGGAGAILGAGLKLKGVIRDLCPLDPNGSVGVWVVLFALLAFLAFILTAWGVSNFPVLRAQTPLWIRLAAAGALSFLIFCLLSPWSLLDSQGFMGSMKYEWDVVSQAGACYVLQFKDTPRYLYQLLNLMSVELWWPLGLTAVAGMIWVLGRFVWGIVRPAGREGLLPLPFFPKAGFAWTLGDLLVLSWFIPYFGFIGAWNTKFIRYMVPLVPAFCIFASRLLTDAAERINRFSPSRFWKPAFWVLVIGPSLFYSISYMHVYTHPHPWFDASVWISKNVPTGSVIATDTWDDGLPQDLSPQQDSRLDKPVNPGNYGHIDVDIYSNMGSSPSDDNDRKKLYYADTLQRGDYISLATKKLWYTLTDETPEFRPHGFNLYPVTSRYFRALWAGLLGYRMVAEFHNFPSLFGWTYPDDMAEETFSVYDHPRVYLFKKIETVAPGRIIEILSKDDYVKGITRDQMRAITPENVDEFISKHNQKLTQEGLLQKLDTLSAPVSQTASALPTPALAVVPAVTPAANPEAAGNLNLTNNSSAPNVVAPLGVPGLPDTKTLDTLKALSEHPVVVEDINQLPPPKEESASYQLLAWLKWVLFMIFLGLLVLPFTLKLLSPLAPGAYALSKIFGLLVLSWVVWFFTSLHLGKFTMGQSWVWILLLVALGSVYAYQVKDELMNSFKKHGKGWMIQEVVFLGAFLAFTIVRMYNPHIHDPYGEGYSGGGEAGMDFGFLSSIVRGESFPPQNMWMAGQPIGYTFYFGHVVMGVVTKALGLVPAVTYNLAIITLFALLFSAPFGIAYALSGRLIGGFLAGTFCAVSGNLAGAKEYLNAFRQVLARGDFSAMHFTFDFWGPSRVIPNSINEFPYFSVLFADMHAHTLGMPFSIFLVALIGALYLLPSGPKILWKSDWPLWLAIGFFVGSIAFLNTWEIPTWMTLLGLALLIKHMNGFPSKLLVRSFATLLFTLTVGLVLAGWCSRLTRNFDSLAVAGDIKLFAVFLGLSLAAGVALLWTNPKTRTVALRFIEIALVLAGILASALLLWLPRLSTFNPQQTQVLWVWPSLRSTLPDFTTIYGLFLAVLPLGLLLWFGPNLLKWIEKKQKIGSRKSRKKNFDWLGMLEKGFEKFSNPQGPIHGMLLIGIWGLAMIIGASWAQWCQEPGKEIIARALLTLAAGFFFTAVYFVTEWVWWMLGGVVVLVWVSLMALHLLPLYQEASFTLNLGLFPYLWLFGFFQLGLASKASKNRPLSFLYLMSAMLFLLLGALEIFAMKEYLGGEWERNNTLFKFGINAWTLASIAAGAMLPMVYDDFSGLVTKVRKESRLGRSLFLGLAGILIFSLLEALLSPLFFLIADQQEAGLGGALTHISLYLTFLVAALGLVWAFMKRLLPWWLTVILSVTALVLLVPPLIPTVEFGSFLSVLKKWDAGVVGYFILPFILASAIVLGYVYLTERKKNTGVFFAFQSWNLLWVVLLAMTLIYPAAATWRKCHGFFDGIRSQWVGSAEAPTLNGLAYMSKSNSADGAAIRFMNDRIPGQPCLAELVGAGYNTWGSRFSIFTGIPALMGWDGHVREWVGQKQDMEISQRRNAEETIFTTTDPALAKSTMDAYGVRLVMVGSLERNGVPGQRGGYPPDGLSKFGQFLPLIYKNPGVEIYYNPPPAKN